MVMLSYKEFSSLVPEKTKIYVDDFLKKLDDYLSWINYNDDLDDMKIFPGLIFMAYMYLNDDRTKVILSSEGYEVTEGFEKALNGSNNSTKIKELFNEYASLFCVCSNIYEYHHLTPQDILNKQINLIIREFNRYGYSRFANEYLSSGLAEQLDLWNCSNLKMENIKEKYKKYTEEVKNIKYEEIKKEIFSELPIDTIEYFITVSNIHNDANKNIVNDDFLVCCLLLGIYYNKDSEDIKKYFESIGLSFSKVVETIKKFSICSNVSTPSNNEENIGILKHYYNKYLNLKEDKNIKITDIINAIMDRSVSESYIFLKILNELDIPIEKLQNIENKIKEFEESAEDFELNKVITNLHNNYPNKLVEYIKYISNLYSMLKEKNEIENFEIKYEEEDLIILAILLSIYRYDNDISSYFISKNITLEKILKYYNLSLEDLNTKNKQYDNKCLVSIYNKLMSKCNISKKEEIRRQLYSNKLIQKMLKDICSEDFDCNKIESNIQEYVKIRNRNQKINQLEKVYKDLKIDTIRFIELCSINYNYMFEKLKGFCSENDVIEFTILASYLKIDDQETKYIHKIFDNDIYKGLPNYISLPKIFINVNEIYSEDTDVSIIKNKLLKYVFGGRNKEKNREEIDPIDILNNIFNKELNHSTDIQYYLNRYKLNYDVFDCNLKDKMKEAIFISNKEKLMKNSPSEVTFEYIDNIDKIYRIIADKTSDEIIDNRHSCLAIAAIINLFYSENDIVKFFKKRNITLERILEYLNITKEELEKFKNLETDFSHINEYIDYKIVNENQYDYIKFLFNCVENKSTYYYSLIKMISKLILEEDFIILNSEVTTKQDYIKPLTKEEKLQKYSEMPIPKLEINSIESISNFGETLSEQSEFIKTDYSEYIENKEEGKEQAIEIQNQLREISKKEEKTTGILSIFSRKKDIEEVKTDKKQVLSQLDNYLKNQESSLKEGLIELQHIRKAIGIYLNKANSYLDTLNDSKEMLEEEIRNKNYVENDFRVYDDNLKMQLLNDKISSINATIVQMLQNYQKITLQMSTHASLINQINISRNTTLQNIFLEMTINEGIIKEKDAINSLNSLMGLLDNMTVLNSQNIVQNIESINEMSKNNEYKEITISDRVLIEQILQEQKIGIESTDEEKKKIYKKNI